MAEALSVELVPDAPVIELEPGAARSVVAKASDAGATFAWTRNGEPLGSGASITVTGTTAEGGIGIYEVTATLTTTGQASQTAAATIDVRLATPETPAVWHRDFAIASGIVIALLALVLSSPAYVTAWRAAFDKDTATQVVAMFLVLPGLLALSTAAFLLLVDYRGRATAPVVVAPAAAGSERNLVPTAGGVAAALKAATELLTAMGKATRGAVALTLASVAIFGFAAWAAVGSGDAGKGEKKPASETSTGQPGTGDPDGGSSGPTDEPS